MPEPKLTRAERAARTREAIIAAVVEAIATRGVRGMRVEDVAAHAGVSTPLLYYHFENRIQLVRAALDHANALAPSGVLRNHEHDATAYDALRDALQRELDEDPVIRNNSIVWNEAYASAVFEPDLRPDLIRVMTEWNSWIIEGIEDGLADDSVRAGTDPERAAELLTAVVEGLSLRLLSGALQLPRARVLLDDAIASVLRPRS